MQFPRLSLAILFLVIVLTTAFSTYLPPAAISLPEGRTYDQAHDVGYLDWSGPVQYFYLTHRDGTSLPPEEGGGSCLGQCQEWVTVLGDGGRVSGTFERDVAYFEVMIAFSHDEVYGNAILQACSASSVSELYLGPGSGYPGFISVDLAVPAGCRTWSLTAQGGFVPFRSVDAYYVSTPPTPLSTATTSGYFTPFPTPPTTRTASPVATFSTTPSPTGTSTASPIPATHIPTDTPTPLPTSTPLPPWITGRVSCGLEGEGGWCRGGAALGLRASDPQGWEVSIRGDVNGVAFTCASSCSLSLSEGVGLAHYTAVSVSGQTASGISTWKLDADPPHLELLLPPPDGDHAWYRSFVPLQAQADDDISGLFSVQVSLDEGATWGPLPIRLEDGVWPFAIQAVDVAGNKMIQTGIVSVDTVPPSSSFSSPHEGEVLSGNVTLSGQSDDETSGVSVVEISSDAGATWQTLSFKAGKWSMPWLTQNLPNGPVQLWTRSTDAAGNVSQPSVLSIWVDNHPPRVSLTERWWIWEAGTLQVSPDYFPVQEVQVTIRDTQQRWPEVVLTHDPDKIPASIAWDRRFADGTLAPAGEYQVLAEACDVHGLCGRDAGVIVVPLMATATPTPSPTVSPTVSIQVSPSATQVPPTLTPTPIPATPPTEADPEPKPLATPFLLWQLTGLLGLMLALASASLIDPRPAALRRLEGFIRQMTNRNDMDSSQEEPFESKGK